MNHISVLTKHCGLFVVPVGNITLHDLEGEKCFYRVLFNGDTEWREIDGGEYERIMEFL